MLSMLIFTSVIVGVSGWIGGYMDEHTRYALYGASVLLAVAALVTMEGRPKTLSSGDFILDETLTSEDADASSDDLLSKSSALAATSSCATTIVSTEARLVLTSLVDQPVGSIRILVGPNGAFGGRLVKNEIILEDSVVSRVHFHLSCVGDKYFIQDCGSTTGTFMYLAPLEKRRLRLQDTVKVGDTEFEVVALQEDYWSGTKPSLRLTFTTGPMRGVTQTIGLSAVTIGRRTTCALCLESDVTVSGQHCTIVYLDSHAALEAGFYVTDLKSTNGTGIRLSPSGEKSQKILLRHKDVFGVGATKFLVEHTKELEAAFHGPVRIA
ncbi:Aste57867_10019 [Aphanomyces stellatus]|uniref:Aste57867_10019 protein n=1 Tax=Aphanomyces stellatus TaxID=120398 RepID=A0A485KPA9_9STRA|nr:hypothetical protein As57867_009980 [Aphanomyces stellatus]VFT86897.1 Aste57867_10019 [Aphanomyces stellatus]